MTLLVVIAALWAAGLFFCLAIARVAAAADAEADRFADSFGMPPERQRPVRGHRSQHVVVRWWDPASSYTVEL